MTVIGITMVKDEIDILPYTLPRMMSQLDHVIVADNMSTDGTLDYLLNLHSTMAPWLTVLPDLEPAYLQSQKMTMLADMARDMDATWIVPFDADEVWYSFGSDLKDHFIDTVDWSIEFACLYDYVVSSTDDINQLDPVKRIGWRRKRPVPLPKVACRPLPGLVIEMGNHGARYPGEVGTLEDSGISIHHYPYRSVEQMARKAKNGKAAYDAAGDRLPAGAGQHWKDYGRFLEDKGISAIEEIFLTWFYSDSPADDESLIFDPCPIRLPLDGSAVVS